jgi:hypothetical protein
VDLQEVLNIGEIESHRPPAWNRFSPSGLIRSPLSPDRWPIKGSRQIAMQLLAGRGDNLVTNQMGQFKATANAHMRRDMETEWKWICQCEACKQIRSLIGMEKTLEVRQRVRELEEIEEHLGGLADGPVKQNLREHYLQLYDQLADEMAK